MTRITPENERRYRRFWPAGALFLSAVLILAVLAWNKNPAPRTPDPLTAAERAWLKAHPVIRLAPDPDFPPVEYFEKDGAYSGIAADYVALVEKRLGIHFEIIRLRNWDEVISRAKRRQIDVFVAGLTPQRSDYLLFTTPFLEIPAVIITREKVKGPLTLETLGGMTVSVVSEYAPHNLISGSHPGLLLDPVPDVRTGLRKVSFGMSDAFVENLATASYYIEKEGISNLRIAGDSGYAYRMGFCSRKDWPELNRILERALSGISAGERQSIFQKWVPLERRPFFASREFRKGLLLAVTAILAIGGGIIAWNRGLARQVSQRTGELEDELSRRSIMEEELRHAREELEKRVEERTAELQNANELLEREIAVRQRNENVIMARLRLLQFAGPHSLDELLEATLNEAEALTGSLIGFYVVVREDQNSLTLQNWSTRTKREYCRAEGKGVHYDLSQAGVWSDCIHQRRPVIHNDYASLLHRKGLPPDHAPLVRELVVPVFRGDSIVAILAVGNKPTEYSSQDVETVSLLADLAWGITEHKQTEEALRKSESRVRQKLESILDPEGNMAELELADILDTPQIQALMDDLHRISGLKMSIIDIGGRVLVDVGWQEICGKFHRIHPETRRRCLESDSELAVGVPPGEFKMYRCRNNMWHLVTPIIVGGRHMANLFMGQFFFTGEQIDYDLFRAQARRYGFSEEEYIAALEAVPRHSEEKVNHGKALFLRLIDMFSRLSYANLTLAHSLAERDRLTGTLREANMVVENSPVVLFRCKPTPGWPVELVSQNVMQFGYTPDEFISGELSYAAIVHPDDLEWVTAETDEYAVTAEGRLRQEYRILTKGGEIRWIIDETNCELNEAGEIDHFEGVIIDVTARKLAEEELKRQKQLLQELNDTLERRIENEVRKSREKDIVLIQQNRQAALGEMLDHIAHQWKQPLNSISLIVQEMAYSSSDGELTDVQVQETIGKIMSLLEHMAQTIDVFRGFYRPDKQKKLFSIKESIDQAISFIAPAFRFQSIAVEIDVDPGLTGFGYPKEYAQALLNILANARDIFRARRTAEPRLILSGFAEGSRSVVTITDNAGGIPEAVQERIFDFYFTTNEAGGGTGIGLYMSKNIIEKNMAGRLGASNVDGGARFRIEIPSA